MRSAPGGLVTFLANNRAAYRADLIKLTLLDATVYRWTTAEMPLVVGGNTFQPAGANGPLVKRGPYSQSARLTIDTLDLTLTGGSFTINGKSLSLLATQGYFDGARIQVDHLIGSDLPSAVAYGPIPSFFEGRIAGMDPDGPALILRAKSELESLNILLPKFPLQPMCGNAVYDASCGLNRATFTVSGAAASGTLTTLQVQTTNATIIAKANGYYNLGVLKFTSGTLSGSRRAVQGFTVSGGTATFTLALPFASAPIAADQFSVYPGCDRSKLQCGAAKFNNLPQFRGYPHIPAAESGA
jgi:uncharacterized phage protein (TIGR02218 family)